MQHVPANTDQAAVWPVSLQNQPGSRSISDDDLCAWCRHLCYRPGERGLITLEPRIFAWMDRLCADYHGGIWQFYMLSNGGAFMAPEANEDTSEKWSLFNSMNGNGAEMSAEAAGIAVCLIAYSHHACRTECDAMTEHYYRLRDYALRHAECSTIMHIID